MKKLAIALTAIMLIVSCKKDTTNSLPTPDQFTFGTYAGFCATGCTDLYLVKDGKLYADNMHQYNRDSLTFQSTPMSSTSYTLAKDLLDDFPQYMIHHSNKTWGCPDCVDQGGIRIDYTANGQTYSWNIAPDSASHPVEVRAYIKRLVDVTKQL